MKNCCTAFTITIVVAGCAMLSDNTIIPGARVGSCFLSQVTSMSEIKRHGFQSEGVDPMTNFFGYSTCEIWVTNPDFRTRPGNIAVGDSREDVIAHFGQPNTTRPPDGKIGTETLFYREIAFEILSNRVSMIAVYSKDLQRGQPTPRN